MKKDIKQEVGLNIRRIREKRGLSQEKLAAIAGIHRVYMGQVERGEKNVSVMILEKIAKALDVDIRVLVDIDYVDG